MYRTDKIYSYYTQYIEYSQAFFYAILIMGDYMISYRPFYTTLKAKDMTEYQLIYKHGFSSYILHRMKHGKAITTKTLDELCCILDCEVADVIEYIRE